MFPELPEARMEMRRLIGFYPLTNKSVNQQKKPCRKHRSEIDFWIMAERCRPVNGDCGNRH